MINGRYEIYCCESYSTERTLRSSRNLYSEAIVEMMIQCQWFHTVEMVDSTHGNVILKNVNDAYNYCNPLKLEKSKKVNWKKEGF